MGRRKWRLGCSYWVRTYTRQRIPVPKISECPEVEHTDDLRTFKYNHGGCRVRKIAICQVPNHSWDYKNYEVVAIFDKLVAVTAFMARPWILLKNQFLYTDEYCDAIAYECLVFAAATRDTVFAWNPYDSVCLSSTVIIIVSPDACGLASFPLLINLLVFPRSYENSTTYT